MKMKKIKIYISKAGIVKQFWDDDFTIPADLYPYRASVIPTITEGCHTGYFFVDMSPLGDMLENPEFKVCLFPPHKKYKEAVAAEIAFIEKEYFKK
jgi:hypothetical protein